MVRGTITAFLAIAAVVSVNSNDAVAQSRHKVIYFKPAPITKTQYSPDANVGSVDVAQSFTAPDQPTPDPLADPSASASDSLAKARSQQDQLAIESTRPSLQQLQNPSGGYQMTFSNFSHDQYMSPNSYMGTQFNTWNNIQMQPTVLSPFESFNRTQPPTSGWYVSPNTYVGGGFSQWNNLSSGSIWPNYVGGWTYSN